MSQVVSDPFRVTRLIVAASSDFAFDNFEQFLVGVLRSIHFVHFFNKSDSQHFNLPDRELKSRSKKKFDVT